MKIVLRNAGLRNVLRNVHVPGAQNSGIFLQSHSKHWMPAGSWQSDLRPPGPEELPQDPGQKNLTPIF